MRRCLQFSTTTATTTTVVSSSSSPTLLASSPQLTLPTVPTVALFEAQRTLRVATSHINYYIRRRGQFATQWPLFRQPRPKSHRQSRLQPLYHWKTGSPYDSNYFLPKENYVTGDWNGLFLVPKDQVYTLQHCTANVPMKIRRFPTTYEFKAHSRWMIGRSLKNWTEPKAHIFDVAALTKKTHLRLIKEGLLPPS
jgi:hypothetical protein